MAKAMPKMDARRLIHEVFTTESSHMSLDEAVADFPVGSINAKTPNVPFSFWHTLEHIRIAQPDLLEYVHYAKHVSSSWPAGSRPKHDATTDATGWNRRTA